jgi:hypothetical protein
MDLEGFGAFARGQEVISPRFYQQCAKFNEEVDAAIEKTYEKKKKVKKRGRNEEEHNDDNMADENIIVISKPDPFRNGEDMMRGPGGYPEVGLCMNVHMPKNVEFFPSYEAFWSNCRGFPTSVTLDILKKMLNLDIRDTENGDTLTLLESVLIMHGDIKILKRPMLCGGDAFWGKQCRKSVLVVEESRRFEYQQKILKLSLALALTRASGSDVYDNKRVEAYGKFMSMRKESIQECKDVHEHMMNKVLHNKARQGCCVHEAMMVFTDVMYQCNSNGWRLRPDNLYLLTQMMISDVMLAINFHESVIGGASNGIGATIVVRDGNGNHRLFSNKDMSVVKMGEASNANQVGMYQIQSKTNGCGADKCVNCYREIVSLKEFCAQLVVASENFTEIKKTSEMGLLQGCCNVTESPMNGESVQTNTVKDTSMRQYSTELKASGDGGSVNSLQAITWMIQRNTTGADTQKYVTTKEDEVKKGRTLVEYQQVIYGYWVLCSNVVGTNCRERMKTILTVTRSMMSAANGISVGGGEDCNLLCMPISNAKDIRPIARPLFFGNMCTTMVSAFVQWTGVLGKTPSSPILETILEVFYMQLGRCHHMLNPDMFQPGDRPRCYEISKARGVAMSLIMTSMEQTIEAGRQQVGQHEAVEGTTLRLMTESCSPHLASWIMADTMEHMFRTDLMIVMQLLGMKLGVPASIGLEDVLHWLRTGEIANEDMRVWWERQTKLEPTQMDKRTDLTEIGACMYISAPDLIGQAASQGLMDVAICKQVGSRLFYQYAPLLQEYCQIHNSQGGEEIVQCMLMNNVNQGMVWPCVFGVHDTLPHFWLTGAPQQDLVAKRELQVSPIRVVVTLARTAGLFVDARWLLLYCGLCGTIPAQASRFVGVAKWIEYFYKTNIPDRMVCNPWLFTGLPSPVVNSGMIHAPHPQSGRRMVRRHAHMRAGLNAPIRSLVVEDLGPAALRYQLAQMLLINEKAVPTDAVSYSFPMNMWCPVKLAGDEFGALKWDNERQKFFLRDRAGERVVSGQPGVFLSGRVTVDMRPLCVFDRPGVAIKIREHEVGVIIRYDAVNHFGYDILQPNDNAICTMNPDATEEAVLPIDTGMLLKMSAIPNRDRYSCWMEDGEDEMVGVEWIRCKLGLLQEENDEAVICVNINVDERSLWRGTIQYGSSHGSVQHAAHRMNVLVKCSDLKLIEFAGVGLQICDKVKRNGGL